MAERVHHRRMNPARLLLTTVGIVAVSVGAASAQSVIKKEIDVGVANLEQVKPVLEEALSPQGKFVLLAHENSVMVIDTPAGIEAAEQALGGADFPDPDVALDFEFVTGLPARRQEITVAQEVPFPTRYDPPQIIVGRTGGVTVVPATPTDFRRRNIGVTSETAARRNPDGSITLDIDTERTELEGFVNYGSAILPSGGVGTVPVTGQVGNPGFFAPFVNAGNIRLPIISTTRISTSVVVRPRVNLGMVELDMMPRLTVELEGGATAEPGVEDEGPIRTVDLDQFRTQLRVPAGEVGRVHGFDGADEAFHRNFFGAEDREKGGAAIVVKPRLVPPGEAKETSSDAGESNGSSGSADSPIRATGKDEG